MVDAVGGAAGRNVKEGDPWSLRGGMVHRDGAAALASCTVGPDRSQQLSCLHEVSLECRHTHPSSLVSVAALKPQDSQVLGLLQR